MRRIFWNECGSNFVRESSKFSRFLLYWSIAHYSIKWPRDISSIFTLVVKRQHFKYHWEGWWSVFPVIKHRPQFVIVLLAGEKYNKIEIIDKYTKWQPLTTAGRWKKNTGTFAGCSVAIISFHTLTVEVTSSTIIWAPCLWRTVHCYTVQSIFK